jgi:hypothetical protein
MLKIVELVKQTLAGLGAGFAATLASVASLASALKLDIASGKQLIIAALGAGFGLIAGLVGNLIKQLVEKARGLASVSYDEIAGLLDEAEGAIRAAKNAL